MELLYQPNGKVTIVSESHLSTVVSLLQFMLKNHNRGCAQNNDRQIDGSAKQIFQSHLRDFSRLILNILPVYFFKDSSVQTLSQLLSAINGLVLIQMPPKSSSSVCKEGGNKSPTTIVCLHCAVMKEQGGELSL